MPHYLCDEYHKQGLHKMEQNNSAAQCGTQDCAQQQRVYSRPVLTLYGSVASLTQAGLGSGTDKKGKQQGDSDRRLKDNIVQVGRMTNGIGLYLFDYKPQFQSELGLSADRQFGVMADEVQALLPEAVSVGSHGYSIVDYGIVGLDRNLH